MAKMPPLEVTEHRLMELARRKVARLLEMADGVIDQEGLEILAFGCCVEGYAMAVDNVTGALPRGQG